MKRVVINEKQPYDDYRRKARIVNVRGNQILVTIAKGFYMLPGGKIEENEKILQALKREIEQETGNQLDETLLHELVQTDTYASNYMSRYYTKPITKYSSTCYYFYDGVIDLNKTRHLTESEKENKFTLKYIDILELISILKKQRGNVKGETYAKELLFVIREYLTQNKLVDLHTHTCYSDGEYTPDEVIDRAKKNHVGTIAITDHDTVEGLKHIHYEKHPGIKIIPGTELNVRQANGKMHILGLAIDYKNEELQAYLKKANQENLVKVLHIIEYLSKKGITFEQEDINALMNQAGYVGRPEIAKLLIKYGYIKTIAEAFDIYLSEAYEAIKKDLPTHSYEEILHVIKQANGIPILAHPQTLHLEKNEMEELIQDMVYHGLKGLEVFHSKMTPEESAFYMELVKKYNLVYSVGSDYHGEHVKPDIKLGYGQNNLYKHNASVLKYIMDRPNL